MKRFKRMFALLLGLMMLITAFSACSKSGEEPAPTESAAPAEETARPERANGERFEDVIMIEGMEEPVRLEHVINETAGFAMDYDYESFVRRGESDRDLFVWGYDDPENPENYLEVSFSPEDAETVAAAVSAALSGDYEVIRLSVTLDGAGECIELDASAVPGGAETADVIQEIYVIPAPDGCRVAKLQYLPEGSDGFGKRLTFMVNTITVMAAQGERRLTDDQALTAIRRYCYLSNPSLEHIVAEGQYPAYWTIEDSSDSQIVVLFRSYTGALLRYYIEPVTGDTHVTEFVPGVTDDEQPTDETLTAWDYLDWWRS